MSIVTLWSTTNIPSMDAPSTHDQNSSTHLPSRCSAFSVTWFCTSTRRKTQGLSCNACNAWLPIWKEPLLPLATRLYNKPISLLQTPCMHLTPPATIQTLVILAWLIRMIHLLPPPSSMNVQDSFSMLVPIFSDPKELHTALLYH